MFAATFQHDMLEAEKNIVNITDVDAVVMETFLTFLYSSKCDINAINTEELLKCAEKVR